MVKSLFIAVLLILNSTVIFAQANTTIVGKWTSEEKKNLVLEIYKSADGLFYGKNQSGKMILQQLKFDAKNKIYKGKMQPPDKDILADVTVYNENPDRLKMVVKKYMMTKIIYLTKIK